MILDFNRNLPTRFGKTSLRAFLSWINTVPLIPKMLSAKRPVFKGRGWASCHVNPVLLFHENFEKVGQAAFTYCLVFSYNAS